MNEFLVKSTPEISSPDEIKSLNIFILLLETSNERYKSFNPTTSFDSGTASISIIFSGFIVDVILTV